MPGRRAKSRAIGPWVDLHDLPPPPKLKKKKPKFRKRLHPSFKVFLALGLMPSKSRQCDPFALRINDTMHIMEDNFDESRGLLTGEPAPNLLERTSESEDSKTAISEESAAEIPEPVSIEQLSEVNVPQESGPEALTNGKLSESSDKEGVKAVSEANESPEIGDTIKSEYEVNKEEKPHLQQEYDSPIEEEAQSEPVNLTEDSKAVEEDKKGNPSTIVIQKIEKPDKTSTIAQTSGSRTLLRENSKDSSHSGSSRSISPSSRPSSPKNSVPQPSCSSKGESTAIKLVIKPLPPSPKAVTSTSNSKSISPSSTPKGSPFHVVKDELITSNDLAPTISFTSVNENPSRKRVLDKDIDGEISSDGESDSGKKKIRLEADGDSTPPSAHPEHQNYLDYERERLIQDFVTECAERPDELNQASDKLHKEVETLGELLKAKEMEWNALLRLKKLKEETLERVVRRKRQLLAEGTIVNDTFLDHNTLKAAVKNQLMMVPIVSSSPSALLNRAPPPMRMPDYAKLQHRPLLPKPFPVGGVDIANATREGRNGPVLDVKSIIADYRSRHPQDIPRRGRRVRGDPSSRSPTINPSSLISMSNMALGSGARIRTVNDSTYPIPTAEQLRSTSSESRDDNSGPGGYKDVLAQFAKLTGQPTNLSAVNKMNSSIPPPPYPEVTLHPVGNQPPSPPSSSLLHGILTKSSSSNRPSNFSPTLARLLTAPDRTNHPVLPPPYRPQASSRVSITDIINSSKKSRNEITITPVPGTQPSKTPKVEPEDDDGESGDRLVIDESADEALQCQGCKQKSAQFVCAGCGNQWYCSRECQVTAWEEHSEVCSG